MMPAHAVAQELDPDCGRKLPLANFISVKFYQLQYLIRIKLPRPQEALIHPFGRLSVSITELPLIQYQYMG